jgi:hypothetical protein
MATRCSPRDAVRELQLLSAAITLVVVAEPPTRFEAKPCEAAAARCGAAVVDPDSEQP